ncbi:embigin [Embiotoca jacksoni]|uniref:embigin n=1 Tax=Embiotoca jacksoni TaxID=100190 RepID=UPI003703D08A
MSASWKQLFFQVFLLLVSCRHINTKTPGVPAAPSLVPPTPLPTDVKSVVLKGESHSEKIELLNPVSLSLECTWTGGHNKLPNIAGYWRKDGEEIQDSRLTVQFENEQYNLKRVFSIVNEKNLGSYSCVFGDEAKIDFILAAPEIGEVRDKPIVSYVGDSVVMECKMGTSKSKPNTWIWYSSNGTEKVQIFPAGEPQRYEIKNEDRKTRLVVHSLKEADSGLYYCGAVYAITTTTGSLELKVITIMEPLKPFLAIVAEVVILVTAILLYERSQSKKKDPAGNEATADQKNMLSQGEDSGAEGSSSTRQRKV